MGSEERIQRAESTDRQLRRSLSLIDVTALVFGALVGSGWLFASYYTAMAVGPAAFISWIIAGVLMLFVALAFAELSAAIPKSGSIVRYPQYTHGSFASFVLSWSYLVASLSVAPAEAIAVVTYLAIFFPWLYATKTTPLGSVTVLTAPGVIIAFALLTVFFLINYYGVKIMGSTNTSLTYIKFVIPIVTILLLLGLALHPRNFSTPSFMPYGTAPIIMSISTTGIVFSYLGFRQGLDFAGETRNPQRDVPLGTILGFVMGIIVYVLLQVSFIGSIPWSALGLRPGNWTGLSATPISAAPFFEVARLSSSSALRWWSWGVMLGAILAPIGTGLIYIGTVSRVLYGMSTNGSIPETFMKLNRHRVPWIGLLISWLIGALYLLPFPSWAYIASLTVFATVFTYTVGGAAVPALRKHAPEIRRPFKLWAPTVMGGIAFIAAYMIVYWAGFSTMWIAVPLVLAGLPIFYIYVAPRWYEVSRSLGAALGVVYWVVLAVTTYFLLYRDIVLPWASISYEPLPLKLSYQVDFWAFVLINLLTTVAFTLVVYSMGNEELRKEINSGWWVIAALFIGIILVFYGTLGPFGSNAPIGYPLDDVSTAVVAAVLYVFAFISARRTKDLEALIQSLKGP